MKIVAADEKGLLEPAKENAEKMETNIEMSQIGQSARIVSSRRSTKQIDVKRRIKIILESSAVTTVMTIVTMFALVGDDIRLWAFWKKADPIFFSGLVFSMLMFATEILFTTVVIDDFKYSFFFWLDIIATVSLIPDIEWLSDLLMMSIFNAQPSYTDVDIIPGMQVTQSLSQQKMQKVIKSLRLIRLIRIIKLYKLMMQRNKPVEDDSKNSKKKKKKKQVEAKK